MTYDKEVIGCFKMTNYPETNYTFCITYSQNNKCAGTVCCCNFCGHKGALLCDKPNYFNIAIQTLENSNKRSMQSVVSFFTLLKILRIRQIEWQCDKIHLSVTKTHRWRQCSQTQYILHIEASFPTWALSLTYFYIHKKLHRNISFSINNIYFTAT